MYPGVTREQISAALFALLAASASYRISSRKLRLWDAVGAADKPALFLQEPGEDEIAGPRGIPGKTTLEYNVFIYIAGNPEDTVPGITQLNNLLDALDTAIKPTTPGGPAGYVQTLGGLVSHCWREGRTLKDPGDLDGYGLAMVPIRVLVP